MSNSALAVDSPLWPFGRAHAGATHPPIWGRKLSSFRNLQPALHRRSCKPAIEPCRDLFQFVERNELPRAVEADQIAHPAQQRDVGDGVVVAHDPLPPVETLLENTEQTLRFDAIAFERAFVLEVLARKFVEETQLAEHRADAAHLEEHPG